MEHEANNTPRSLASEARDWVIRRHSGDFSPRDEVEFQRWIGQSPEHVLAYDEQERFWSGSLAGLEATFREHMAPAQTEQGPRAPGQRLFRRAPAWMAVVGTLAACCALALFLRSGHLSDRAVLYATGVGEVRTVALEDGTQLSLDTDSRVRVSYHAEERFVDLKSGAVFLSVASDPNRPLRVQSHDALVEVLGTRFAVDQRDSATWVGVAHGRVRGSVRRPDGAWLDTELQAGQGVSLDPSLTALFPVAVNVETVAPWRDGLIEIDEIPLDAALAHLDTYFPGQILLDDVDGPFDPVSGIFRIENVEEAAAALAATHELATKRVGSDLVISQQK